MKRNMRLKIAVVYNRPPQQNAADTFIATEVDTEESALEIVSILCEHGYRAYAFPVTPESIQTISKIQADCIFDLIEWTGAELDSGLAAVRAIEATGIPFTGATSRNYHLTSDKSLMKQALLSAEVPVPQAQLFTTGEENPDASLTFPLIVKPTLEHCSIGLDRSAIVHTAESLKLRVRERIRTFKQPVLAEEFIVGREFQVTTLETEAGITVLPPAEILFTAGSEDFLTYSSRWDDQHPDYTASKVMITPLDAPLLQSIETIAKRTFIGLGFRDYNRLDIRVRDDQPYILEANSNPGLDDNNEYGLSLSFRAVGMTYADFLQAILHSAIRRFTRHAPAALPVQSVGL